MEITYKIDWDNGIQVNKKELLLHKMWEDSFGSSSTFYKYYTNDFYFMGKSSTLKMYLNNELVGVLICPELQGSEILKVSVGNKKKRCFVLGEIQLYIKPEFRKMGLASKLVKTFDKALFEKINNEKLKDDVVFVLQATQRSVAVCQGNMTNFAVFNIFGLYPEVLIEKVKGEVLQHGNKLKTLKEWREFNYIPYLTA